MKSMPRSVGGTLSAVTSRVPSNNPGVYKSFMQSAELELQRPSFRSPV